MTRLLYLGQKPVGEKAFQTLLEAGGQLQVVAACSNGTRQNWWNSCGIYDTCSSRQIPFLDNTTRNEDAILKLIKRHDINMLVSVQHNWILSGDILEAVGGNALNLHLAKLPDYKGNFSFNHAILNGEKEYTVTLHWMNQAVDEGQVCLERTRPIAPQDTAASLYSWSVDEAGGIVWAVAQLLAGGQTLPKGRQIGSGGHFYARDSLDGLRELTDLDDAKQLDRKCRAFWMPPFEGAYFVRDDKKYYVRPEGIE